MADGETDSSGKTKARTEVSFVGNVHQLTQGQRVQLEGEWVEHPTYGKQVKVIRYVAEEPKTDVGVILWMTTYIPLLGDVLSRRVWDTFGKSLWDVIDEEPQRLKEVEGIGDDRMSAIVHAYAQYLGEREALIRFFSYGFSQREADHVIGTLRQKLLGDDVTLEDVIRLFEENPYALYTDHGLISFGRIDFLAQQAGVPEDDPRRTSAAVLYSLEQLSFGGHTASYYDDLESAYATKMHLSSSVFEDACVALVDKGAMVTFDIDEDHVVLMHRKYANAEETIAKCILQRLEDKDDDGVHA